MDDNLPLEESGWPADAQAGTDDTQWTHITPLSKSATGMMAVLRARRYGKWHVLKTLQPAYRDDPAAQAMLRKEFDIAFTLSHPAIAAVIGLEQVPALGQCIVQEWVDGGTLRECLAAGRIDAETAVDVLTQLLGALDYLHSRGVTHRDLKPSNIMLTADGRRVKIIDFGVSDTAGHAVFKGPAGTRRYAAPEVLQGEPGDARADLYSLGVIAAQINDALPRHHRGIARLAAACTQPEAGRRPSSARAAAALLKGDSRARWLRLVAAVAVAATLAAALWLLAGRDAKTTITQTPREAADTAFITAAPVEPVEAPAEHSVEAPVKAPAEVPVEVAAPVDTTAVAPAVPPELPPEIDAILRKRAYIVVFLMSDFSRLDSIARIDDAEAQSRQCRRFILDVEHLVGEQLEDTYSGDAKREKAFKDYLSTARGKAALHAAVAAARGQACKVAALKKPSLAPHFDRLK